MTGAHQRAGPGRTEVSHAVADGRRRVSGDRARAVVGPRAVLALQRDVGNAAVSALMAAKLKSPGEQAVADIDAALREVRRDEPVIDTVEKGLKAAKTAGVPVDLEGPKPPPSALAVTTTGFGPESVAAKKPVPPAKPVPAVSPLGKGPQPWPPGRRSPAEAQPVARRQRRHPPRAARPHSPSAPHRCRPTSSSRRPCRRPRVRPEDDPAFTQVTGNVKALRQGQDGHTRPLRRRRGRRRTRRSPRPTTSPGRPRRPRSTRWTPSRRAPSTRRPSSRR